MLTMGKLVLVLLVFLLDSTIAHTFGKTSEKDIWLENERDVGLASTSIFDVSKLGAKGDGKIDDTKAFQKTWLAACKMSGSTLLVPRGFTFLINPITFSGPCASNIIFQVDGNVIANTNVNAWKSKPESWILFKNIQKGITVQGHGVLDGQGSIWWKNSYRPLALMMAQSSHIKVTGVTIKNSGRKHLKVYECIDVKIFSMSVVAPGDSPNTDGINLANSQKVVIHDINVASGDDCISILGGCKDVEIYNIKCGPSHGISIGGLGREGSKDYVSNITVRDSNIKNSKNGVRIKSFQGGKGSVKGVRFSNIELTNVESAIVIDQYYCNGERNCKNDTSSAVAISGFRYEGISGSYNKNSINLLCSDPYPCKDLTFSNINLKPTSKAASPICYKAYGKIKPPTIPQINCLIQ